MLTVQLNSSPLCNDKLTETTIIAPKGIKSNVTTKENLQPHFAGEIFSNPRSFYVKSSILYFSMKTRTTYFLLLRLKTTIWRYSYYFQTQHV